MTYRIEKKKWILYRHTNNFDLITAVAVNLKYFSKASISKDDKLGLLLKLKDLAYYKERNPELPLDSINHRINTLAYYMFGYKDTIDGQDRFLFSPLGNLFLKHIDNKENLSKIFFTMLWAIQFKHPHGGSDKVFNLYPFRLIFKLLSDERIENRLFAYEVSYLLVFIESIDNQNYEKLVSEILKIRKWNNAEIEKTFKENQHTVTLNPHLKNLCQKLMVEYPFDEKPLQLEDPERLKIDVVKQIYNFYPQVLLEEIGEKKDDLKYGLLNLAKLIEQYSNNNDGAEAYLFEDILTDGFNMFVNVEAKKIGGAGNADLECLYITKKKKFAVDAKSTKNKLSGLNAGRLAEHRTKIGGEYTIVVTPRYVPAVLHDIKSAPIVIIRASTFSEYLYNHIDNEVREIDYADFDNIIVNNLGKDISRNISTLTIDKFSVKN